MHPPYGELNRDHHIESGTHHCRGGQKRCLPVRVRVKVRVRVRVGNLKTG